MLNKFNLFLTAAMNGMYGVRYHVQQFKTKEPGATIIHAAATKGRKLEQETELKYEPGWITARRGTLILTKDKLVCEAWVIPLAEIEKAQLYDIRQFGIVKGHALKVATRGGDHYLFGLQYDPAWEKQTTLPLTNEDGQVEFAKLKYSRFSIATRLIFWLVFFWMCWTQVILPHVWPAFNP